MKRILTAPAHVVETAFMMALEVGAIIATAVYMLTLDQPGVAPLFWVMPGMLLFVILLMGFITRRGLVYVSFDEDGIWCARLGRRLAQMRWDEIGCVTFTGSHNYGKGYHTVAILTREPATFPAHYAAMTYDPRTQIVVRLSKKNYDAVMEALRRTNLEVPTVGFETMQRLVRVNGITVQS